MGKPLNLNWNFFVFVYITQGFSPGTVWWHYCYIVAYPPSLRPLSPILTCRLYICKCVLNWKLGRGTPATMHITSFDSKNERKKTLGCHFRQTVLTKKKTTFLGGWLFFLKKKKHTLCQPGCRETGTLCWWQKSRKSHKNIHAF